jgi:hypothetical protein
MREIIEQVLKARLLFVTGPTAAMLAAEIAEALEANSYAQWTGIGGPTERYESTH